MASLSALRYNDFHALVARAALCRTGAAAPPARLGKPVWPDPFWLIKVV